MKVVICKGQTMGPISGADETLVTYATHLHQAGVSISVLLMFPRENDNYYTRLVRAGVPVRGVAPGRAVSALHAGRHLAAKVLLSVPRARTFVRSGSRTLSVGLARRYFQRSREYLSQLRPDVIHVITPDSSSVIFIQAGHSLGIPVLYQELGIPFHPPGYESHYRHFTSVLPLCSEIAALSPTLAKMCQQRMLSDRLVSVLPAMAEDVTPEPKNGAEGVTFGFAARIETIKGVAELMEAFGVARRQDARIKLNVAGVGSKANEMNAHAAALGAGQNFQHLGAYSDSEGRTDFLRKIDVLVLPSYTEGTPNSIIEAMSRGIPVIASAVGGIPDMLGLDSNFLVPVGDAAALAEAMLTLAGDRDLRMKMGQTMRERYLRLFSPQVVLPLLLKTYDKLIAGQRAGD